MSLQRSSLFKLLSLTLGSIMLLASPRGVSSDLPLVEAVPPANTKVKLTDLGDRVSLDNGIVNVEVEKRTGNIGSIIYQGQSMLASPAYLNLHAGDDDTDFRDHASTYARIGNGKFEVIKNPALNGGEIAEICITQPSSGDNPFALELHYALRQAESGLYAFVVISHEQGKVGGEISQIRWLFRLSDKIFDFVAIDSARRHEMPPSDTPTRPLGPKESLLVTQGPSKGQILDKYHDFVDAGEHFVHGWIGREKKVGCWMISASTEDQNGGPTKQFNTAHFGRILMKIFSCTHYGAAPVKVGKESWQKLYGPCLLYFNSGKDQEGLWQDANNKAATERNLWPYAWMSHPLYPLSKDRGAVRGQFKLSDPTDSSISPSGAWVGLAAPSPDWQQQSNGYQFWVRADAKGQFNIPAVRPGNYTLYAFTDGVMDECRQANVVVERGKTNEMGTIDWKPPHFGKILWQIGVPDRTAKEFRHGDNYRRWGLWEQYRKEFPNDVNFVIGSSRERVDWNYAQVAIPDGPKWIGTEWRVLFDLDSSPKSGEALLRLAIAAATNADLVVSINGKRIGELKTEKDSAMIRAGIHGQYSQMNLKFSANNLKKGRNVLSLEQRAGRSMQTNIMYDCLRLELAEGI